MKYLYTLLACLALCGGVQAQTSEDLQAVVSYLASDELQGRNAGSTGIAKAQYYITKELLKYGIYHEYQSVPNSNCRNLVAWIKGGTEEYVVVGAHLDHVGRDGKGRIRNGADDNASGSAAILELAKRMSEERIKPTWSVVFVWFTGEETGLEGAKQFVNNPLSPYGSKLPKMMINLDMIGHLDKNIPYDAVPPRKVDPLLGPLYERYPFAKRITYMGASMDSDHLPFNSKGVPCITIHTGLTNTYHRPSDDADTLDYSGMVKICHYAYDLLLSVAGIQPSDYGLMTR